MARADGNGRQEPDDRPRRRRPDWQRGLVAIARLWFDRPPPQPRRREERRRAFHPKTIERAGIVVERLRRHDGPAVSKSNSPATSYIDVALAEGAQLLYGGQRSPMATTLTVIHSRPSSATSPQDAHEIFPSSASSVETSTKPPTASMLLRSIVTRDLKQAITRRAHRSGGEDQPNQHGLALRPLRRRENRTDSSRNGAAHRVHRTKRCI